MQLLVKPVFLLSLAIELFTLATMGLPTTEADVYDLIASIKKDDNAIVSLGADGVLRSICTNLTVLAYEKLNNNQIQKLIDGYGRDDRLSKAFEGVNGQDVVDQKQLMHADKDFLPAALPSEEVSSPATSKNDAIQVREDLLTLRAKINCPASQCYGIGNCAPACQSCYVPYPGYAGSCH